MEALTPASPDSLPPLGELISDVPFWRYRIGTAGEGVAHLRVWLTAAAEPGRLAVVTESGTEAPVTESTGHIWAELTRRDGPRLCCLSTIRRPRPEKARRLSTWSASAPTAARTGCVSGRRLGSTPVMPGSSCGWLPTGTRSSASRRTSSTGARTRAADRRPPPECQHPELPSAYGNRGDCLHRRA
jgi:hypothetical protein